MHMKPTSKYIFALMALLCLLPPTAASAGNHIIVRNNKELQTAIAHAAPGHTILVAPGQYTGEISIKAVAGTTDARITIRGIDAGNKPVISGGTFGLHLSNCRYVTLKNIVITNAQYNGINIDDGGDYQTPSEYIRLEQIDIYHTGGKGNHDGIKLSGVDHFDIVQCRVIGWGGSAIDMVGCHNGRIDQGHFESADGFSQRNGVQAKGGSSSILVQRSFFKNAGTHALVIGGNTNKDYFRPKGANYEAKEIRASGNIIIGSRIPIAWGSAMGGEVTYNTIVNPQKAVIRIYQSIEDPYFVPCQAGRFAHNLVVTGTWPIRMAKIEKGTLPKTFMFQNNAWFSPQNTIIRNLPVPETDGIHQIDPELRDTGNPQMRFLSNAQVLQAVGAQNYRAD